MSTEENKALIRKVYSEWNEVKGDLNKVRSLLENHNAPGFIVHHVSRGDLNQEQGIQFMMATMSAFPDLQFKIEDMIAEGDKVVTRYRCSGTHKGTIMGIPPTGKTVLFKGVEIDRIADGKFVESWDYPDSLGLMISLGVIPGVPGEIFKGDGKL